MVLENMKISERYNWVHMDFLHTNNRNKDIRELPLTYRQNLPIIEQDTIWHLLGRRGEDIQTFFYKSCQLADYFFIFE